jgi:acetylglutamate/LysW-gamma-L-alpha-aminoadipate kinase
MDIFNMVYAGKMNKMLVEKLQKEGINVIGLAGLDGRILEGSQKEALKIIEDGKKKILRGDLSGMIERVNVKLLRLLLENVYTPVLHPLRSATKASRIAAAGRQRSRTPALRSAA